MPRIKQRPDGRYLVRYHGICFYGKTQTEAKEKRDNYLRESALSDRPGESHITVYEYASKWLPVAKASVERKTYNDYANLLDKLCSVIGAKEICSVTPLDIKKVYSTHFLNASNSTIHRARMLYISLFNSAQESSIVRANPCKQKSGQPHKGSTGTHRAITEAEKQLLLNTPHRFQIPALIMLYAGLRRGEVLALRTDDIDLTSGTISVSKAIRYDGNAPILTTPKTDAGTRVIPIFAPLRPFLEHLPHGYICTDSKGNPMSETAFSRAWESYLSTLSDTYNGFTKRWRRDRQYIQVDIRPHDLRHTFCVMCRDAGVDLKICMRWLGHADEKMILRVYDHISDRRLESAISSVNKIL